MLHNETAMRIVGRIVLAMTVLLAASGADAQDRLGGHFGVVLPLVTHADGETTNISDNVNLGFPMGITVKTAGRYAFDLEIVPTLDTVEGGPINVPLTIHPGVLGALGNGWTAGLRMAFDIGNASWGFTPLLNKGFHTEGLTYFVEGVVPIRFQDDTLGETHTAITLGVHLGIGF